MMAGKGYGRAGGGAMMAKKLQFRCIDGEKEGGGVEEKVKEKRKHGNPLKRNTKNAK